MAPARAFFVVFEGIDGSGKTTLSSRVAKELRKRGLDVEHVREEGEFSSHVTGEIRAFTRDSRNVGLTPHAELLLYAAREAQLWSEVTAPAIAKRQVVIADRFFYTPEVLAREGRGLPADSVRAMIRAAAAGAEPDLVVLVDVDPHVARARRRASKVEKPSSKAPSRKGLAGSALQERLAAGYRAMASAEPSRWVVVDNTDAALDAQVARITSIIAEGQAHGVSAGMVVAASSEPVRPASRKVSTPAEALAALLEWVRARAEREPAVAAWMLGGLAGREIDSLREALAARTPAVVVFGTRGLQDEASWRLRERLADAAPEAAARSVVGTASLRADALLEKLAERAPGAVASALAGRDDAQAWSLRDRLFDVVPDEVARGCASVTSARARELRARWLAWKGGESALSLPAAAGVAAKSIEGVDDESAWAIRRAALGAAPVEVLESLLGLVSQEAFRLRREHLVRAPKPVMESLYGTDHPEAWSLRAAVATTCKEAIDSIEGLDVDPAWSLREACLDAWPSTVAKSAVPLAGTPRGRRLVQTALEKSPGHIAMWRQAAVIALKENA